MIIADTSVWVGPLRGEDRTLERDLVAGSILIHPFVIGEIALGHLRQRKRILDELQALPMATVAADDEVLSGGAALWTYDRPLREAAQSLGLAYDER